MKNMKISFVREGITCSGKADVFGEEDLPFITSAYFVWKELNRIYANYNMRRANFPELLSEGLTSVLMGQPRTNGTTFVGLNNNSMDLVDIENGKTIQLKSCSTDAKHEPGPTSFGPKTEFDKLVFMHVDCENDTANWYELDESEYKNWKVNRNETIADQQKAGRRPRLTVLNKIKKNNLVPFMTYTFSKN